MPGAQRKLIRRPTQRRPKSVADNRISHHEIRFRHHPAGGLFMLEFRPNLVEGSP
jgi:hypothetical protein